MPLALVLATGNGNAGRKADAARVGALKELAELELEELDELVLTELGGLRLRERKELDDELPELEGLDSLPLALVIAFCAICNTYAEDDPDKLDELLGPVGAVNSPFLLELVIVLCINPSAFLEYAQSAGLVSEQSPQGYFLRKAI